MSLLVAYQNSWPDDFKRIRDYLLTKVNTHVGIEHIGSTSIPGMVAKPIIDLIIIVPPGAMSQTIAELAELEYRHQGDLGIPGRECFDYLPSHIELPCHHLYACYPDQPQVAGSLAFRDFMRANEEWREQLSNLKSELDRQHNSNRQLYMTGKKQLVEKIIGIAKEVCPQPAVYSPRNPSP